MIEPTQIKQKELMFYFEEYLEFKGIHKTINLYKIYTNIKNVFSEIYSGHVAIFGITAIVGGVNTYFQKLGNNINNNINGIDIMDIDNAKIKIKNGKNMSLGYGLIDKSNYDLNHPFNIVYMLASCFVSIYATHNHINSKSKNKGDM